METKELQELVDGLMALSVKLAKHLKDGFQMHDIPNLLMEYKNDATFAETINKAFEGISKVPEEMKHLELSTSMPIVISIFGWIQKLVAEVKDK